MPLPASLFLQRGRSDSMMSTVEDEPQQQHSLRGDDATVIDQSASQTSSSSSNMLQAGIELDASGAPMYTPPITMTAFDNQYGPHGLLASAMSSSYGSSPFSGSSGYNNASSMSSYPFNPRANLLRRTSSSSTLDNSEDEDEVAWSAYDVERLTAVYEACVEEASFETPFSGPPPSQLLHAIAKACRRVYGTEWPHSITQTRIKALQIAKEKERLEHGDWAAFVRRPSVEATPKPPGSHGEETEATPRRRLRRNDSMDFLPDNWDLDAVARLSDKLNKSGEDDHSLFQYPYRVRTDTCSSGSDGQRLSLRSAPLRGGLLRSLTSTSLNKLEGNGHFSASSLSRVPGEYNGSTHAYQQDYSQHHLASSDPSLLQSSALTMSGRRPSLRPSFELFGGAAASSAASSASAPRQMNQTLHHAPSTSSFFSEQSSSLYSAPSLNSSMDTMNFSSNATEDGHSIYGSSFASSTVSSNPFTLNRKRAFTGSMHAVDPSDVEQSHIPGEEAYGKDMNPFGLAATDCDVGAMNDGAMQTPSAVDEANATASDYFATFADRRPSVIHLPPQPPTLSTTSSFSKKPNLASITTTSTSVSGHSKPPLMKSYTFDAISSKSPTKKYLRMSEEGYNALDTTVGALAPSPRSLMYANGIGYGGAGGMMLESPFEMEEQSGQRQKLR
ncbi:hypothetical protein P389DRAFT_205109 [Cystobasidium minutum MCA 4210]|uniref:uncharacterized protein n=1 Tax=Cystobasidium minutum MCA 4210 TaxID=1397322 RepID=UPI0034CE4A78|eukprot:jgi/Rhomi1/205109/MIX5938_73_78